MICDAFHCTPSQAVREPLRLCLDIIDQRAYAKAYHRVMSTPDPRELPNDPVIQEVRSNQVIAQAEALMRWGQEIG